MTICKHCNKIVPLDSLSKFGMCNSCEDKFQRMISILTQSTNIINNTKNITTLINRCHIVIDILDELKEFEHLDIIHPPPHQLINDVIEKRSGTIIEYWEDYCGKMSQKLTKYNSIDLVIKIIEDLKKLFNEYQVYIANKEKLKDAKFWIEHLIDIHITGKYNPLIDEAKEFEKNKEYGSAIVKLNEALNYFEKIKNYFEEQNQDLDIELKEWIKRLSV